MLRSFVLRSRPFIIFDATKAEHRDIFHTFQKTKSWQHSPYQWALDDDSSSVVHSITNKVIAYYLAKEFDRPVKTAKVTKAVLKIKDIKTVNSRH